ncbi:hypothetical protein F383_12200 [Gossypium arboreum]|uniref:Uncharacterized protein n=1 Tax=Gossypium arboreum TaxID=29729 RepID=A0A0B0MG93_GOSAR|nr:hypothetical protein F383_38533 [Gossypium arboreum]KHG01178.1 hypothetical protein F383_39205 [Gossypium arboreum]KHG09002.1 hypothetical protein F383_36061 [Gossypium arboreum]KHG26996.1 hypothetical protein F383_33563 [Gossypium arboreum]KHG30034.1 hypothetical protein F383_12200 [Gossypium arboreum]
MDQSASLE